MEAMLSAVGLPYHFVDTVDGVHLTHEERDRLIDERAVAKYPGWLTPGMCGAALSHAQAMREILNDGADMALILEDDAVVPAEISAIVSELEQHLRGAEVILLDWRTPPGSKSVASFSSVSAIPLESFPGTLMYPHDLTLVPSGAAYLVTRAACERLLDVVLPIRVAPDSWSWFYEWGGVDSVRCVVPAPVALRDDFKSTTHLYDAGPLRGLSAAVARYRVPGLYDLAAIIRRWRVRRMRRYRITDTRSPLQDGVRTGNESSRSR